MPCNTAMPTYKNIKIKKRGGGTRLQRVQVLASGKYKFVKNLVKGKRKTYKITSRAHPRKRSASKKKASNMGKNKGKMFRILGTQGALEDFAWGFAGLSLMGVSNPSALPTIRLVQGLQGHVLNRVGKGRLIYAMIDLLDLILAGTISTSGVFDNIKQLAKIAPML